MSASNIIVPLTVPLDKSGIDKEFKAGVEYGPSPNPYRSCPALRVIFTPIGISRLIRLNGEGRAATAIRWSVWPLSARLCLATLTTLESCSLTAVVKLRARSQCEMAGKVSQAGIKRMGAKQALPPEVPHARRFAYSIQRTTERDSWSREWVRRLTPAERDWCELMRVLWLRRNRRHTGNALPNRRKRCFPPKKQVPEYSSTSTRTSVVQIL